MLAAPLALPHHSFAAVFDINRPIEFTGTVSRLEWTNPHAWIYIDVEDAEGEAQTWSIELLGINTLLKQGWKPDILKPGDVVQVALKGYARDGRALRAARVVVAREAGEEG